MTRREAILAACVTPLSVTKTQNDSESRRANFMKRTEWAKDLHYAMTGVCPKCAGYLSSAYRIWVHAGRTDISCDTELGCPAAAEEHLHIKCSCGWWHGAPLMTPRVQGRD